MWNRQAFDGTSLVTENGGGHDKNCEAAANKTVLDEVGNEEEERIMQRRERTRNGD